MSRSDPSMIGPIDSDLGVAPAVIQAVGRWGGVIEAPDAIVASLLAGLPERSPWVRLVELHAGVPTGSSVVLEVIGPGSHPGEIHLRAPQWSQELDAAPPPAPPRLSIPARPQSPAENTP